MDYGQGLRVLVLVFLAQHCIVGTAQNQAEESFTSAFVQKRSGEGIEEYYQDDGRYMKRPQRFSFGLGKRKWTEEDLAEYQDLNQQVENIPKRAPYQFGIGKRADDLSIVTRAYAFGLGKRAYDFGLGKRAYDFGLGKRAYDFSLGKRAYDFGLGKRAYDFGLGKREPYAFGLGKRSPYEFGLGKREPYAFGLGKRTYYGFGLGKREPYAFGLGRR